MAELYYLDVNTWRYENAGTADSLLTTGTTLTNLPASQSKTGTAFYQTARAKCFDLPATAEVWIKFDVYFNGSHRWRAYNEGSNGSAGVCSYSSSSAYDFGLWSNGSRIKDFSGVCVRNTRQTILLHMVSGTSNGTVEAWVDGNKIYTYTGNVNRGANFANIYLQSDGSGTFFSNVIISNAEIGLDETLANEVAIKPFLFASILPERFIPASEKISADTQRNIKNTEKLTADLFRKVIQDEKISVDLLRIVVAGELHIETFRFNTLRKVGIGEKFSADTSRTIKNLEKTAADTFRQVATSERVSADVLLRMRDCARADTERKITRSEKTLARTVIRIPHIFNYFIQPRRLLSSKLRSDNPNSLVNTFKQYGVTAINITLAEKTLSDDFRFNIVVPVNIQDTIELKLLDYEFSWIVEETTQRDLVQSVRGKYNVDDLLYTWFTVKTKDDDADEFDENAEDGGGYFTAQKIIEEEGKKLGFDSDNIFVSIDDFTPSNIEDGSVMTYADLLNNLFGWTSRVPQRQINVFIRGKKLYCIQRGKEGDNSSFDITNLPHSRPTINRKFNRVLCYNPNKTDDDDDDDDNKKHKFSGTLFLSSPTLSISYTYAGGLLVQEQLRIQSTAEDGKIMVHQTSTSYSYRTHTEIKTSGSESGEEKIETENTYYLEAKSKHTIAKEIEGDTTTITETTDTTNYHYKTVGDNELYLFAEYEKSVTKEYEKAEPLDFSSHNDDITEINIRETHHVPLGNGFYAQTVFLNGQPQGANISQGKPGGAVSPYTVDRIQGIFNSSVTIDIENEPEEISADTDELSLIVDDSFPVRESAFKDQLNEDLRALHRKIVETVTVDLISKVDNGVPEIEHIVDFTDTVSLDGKDYFLVSNNISFTPRKFIQKLQLIRWE
ncbi:MAG: hypothetical protein IKI76_09325 [Selenomonadaceae bacterium]|nr:hypothetical protein [Selenomonadaceae bacterium]